MITREQIRKLAGYSYSRGVDTVSYTHLDVYKRQFVALTQKSVDVQKLTPTIVNEYIKKIEVVPPDKSSGKRVQKVKIYFNCVYDVEIPVISEPVVAKSTPGRRKTA